MSSDLQIVVNLKGVFMGKLKEKLNRILSNNTHQPIEKIYEDTERDNFLNAKEAKEYGLIDDIIKKNEF